MPDDVILLKIKKKNLYLDKKSREELTGRVKRKYKLAGNNLLSHYFFNILTRHQEACKKNCTLEIKNTDWEDKIEGKYLEGECSFCDVTKCEVLEIKELINKIKDRNNGFKYIAKLSDLKYRRLQKVQKRACYIPSVPLKTKNLITKGISDVVSDAAIKLGLN